MGDKGRIRRRILVLAGLVPGLVSLTARAEPRDYGPFDVVGAGVFVGYTFGDKRGVDWGLEGFATRHFRKFRECGDNGERSGFGPLLRLSALNVSRLAVTGAGHIGGEAARPFVAADLELGGTLAMTRDGSLGGLHTGVTLESILFNVYARQEWLLRSYSVGGGARFMPTFGLLGRCDVGRAFRDHDGQARSRVAATEARFDERCPDAARWAERASDECSSVLAFLQLALELLDEDAPLELVARAVRSAEQELSHTVAAAGLASRFGQAKVAARAPSPRFRARLPRRRQLARLARESWVDGCLNEGLAALIALAEASDTKDPEEARVSAKIARDEAEHAALAFDVVRWIIEKDPSLAPPIGKRADGGAVPSSLLEPQRVRELAALHASRAVKLLEEPSPSAILAGSA
jgi:hypothetical protein